MATHHYSGIRGWMIACLTLFFFAAGTAISESAPETVPHNTNNLYFSDATIGDPAAGDWPLYSHDFSNSNFNSAERLLKPNNIRFLRRTWETFNDDSLVDEDAPTGFVLESVLGLEFPAPVVGVVASPIIRDDTIYFVDALGTVFARDAHSGAIVNPAAHWTTSLVDPDFDSTTTPVLPELIYTAPIVTDRYIWVLGSAYGQLHLLERRGGQEVDFDPQTPETDPFQIVPDLPFSSILGEAVIVEDNVRKLLIVSINVILNDALVQGEAGGLQIALDISQPARPVEAWRRNTLEIDPATGLRFGSGVSAGAGLAVDLERNLIFGGTGQNTSDPYPGYPDQALAPAGFIDRSDSLYAINFTSGEFVWSNQFHRGDIFNLNAPVSTGPNQADGPRDADVLSPPILFSVNRDGAKLDLVGNGSKGGLFRVVERDSGRTVWQRQISKPTGIGGIQAGAAVARGVIYVAGFEGIDDGFSDAQFGDSLESGLFFNAFFATFSPLFWADVEDVNNDVNPATGMRIKLFALDAESGESRWHFDDGRDYVELLAGAALRHVSVANGLLFVTTSSGQLIVINATTGKILFTDQSVDLNRELDLGLSKAHHASMNGGSIVSDGMVYVPYGAQNNPSGGLIAYTLNLAPYATPDFVRITDESPVIINAMDNDNDPNGDTLQFIRVAGRWIDPDDGVADLVHLRFGTVEVVNPGDDPASPQAAFLKFTPNRYFRKRHRFNYQIADIAPARVVNNVELDQLEPTHTPRRARSLVWLFKAGGNGSAW